MNCVKLSTVKWILIISSIKYCNGDLQQSKFSNIYNTNQVLALREELSVDGLKEDSSFNGGKGVEQWMVLPSIHDTYLIGLKKKGLSLISISKKIGSLFQAIEKQIDIEETITSVTAFNYLNPDTQRLEGIIIVSTGPPKHEIIWFKIQNYKLVRFWSWVRYSETVSLHHFKVMREDMLLILDSNRLTAYLYFLSFNTPTPKIREMEVIPFEQKVLGVSITYSFPEPFLFTLHEDGITVYRYKRFCPESMLGSFLQQTTIRDMGVKNILSFHSEGREYLALAGRESGVLRIDTAGSIYQEFKMENIIDWIIMKTGPSNDRILLFGKTSYGDINVFSNVGLGWNQHKAPLCYKDNKDEDGVQEELSCLKNKSWNGVASLEIGDLPTLVFSDRKYYGEIYHVMLTLKRDILPLQGMPYNHGEYLMRMKSNFEDFVSDIGSGRAADNTCNIFDMLTAIENIVAEAKDKISETCGPLENVSLRNSQQNVTMNAHMGEKKVNKNDTPIKLIEGDKEIPAEYVKHASERGKLKGVNLQEDMYISENLYAITRYPSNARKISPELEDRIPMQDMVLGIDISADNPFSGIPKKSEALIN